MKWVRAEQETSPAKRYDDMGNIRSMRWKTVIKGENLKN
jgi:hypothetical protein